MINLWVENKFNEIHFCNLIPLTMIESLKNTSNLRHNPFASQMAWLTRENVEINFYSKNDIEQNGIENIIYPIELYWSTNALEPFYVDLEFLKKSNATVLLWWPKEPFTNSSRLRKAIEAVGKINIVFITGNLKKPATTVDFPNVTYKFFDYWWFYLKNFMSKKPKLSIDKVEKYEFTFFNRRLNLHRSAIYYRMLNNNRLNNSKHSYHATYMNGDYYSSDEVLGYLRDEVAKFKELDYRPCDEYEEIINDTNWYDWVYSQFHQSLNNYFPLILDLEIDLHNESYLDVITESCVYPNRELLFITEKTYRSIANGCIFLIMGCSGTLKYLKSQGFQTFDDLFDESYDDDTDMPHWFDRWKIIEKNLDIWQNLGKEGRRNYYIKSFDKLVHNQNILYSRSFKEEIVDLFRKI